MSHVRVRFAPSPTGHLHIGGLRTALFNYLFARHQGGSFLLRIEDTDGERSTPEFEHLILEALAWAGLVADEPVVRQSERLVEHQAVVEELVRAGKAYRCVCTPLELRARLGQAVQDDPFAHYDGYCRTRQAIIAGKPFVVRFIVPEDGQIVFEDLILGTLSLDATQLYDFIIARSDGRPIYNFVVVVDDAYMKISHVIRGADHISNTFKQILIYRACGYQLPLFAHLPLILNAAGGRLSKRDGAVSVQEYEKLGYLAPALLNYLARLGWSHGDQEIFTMEQLIEHFSLQEVGKKGAIFDMQKLGWVNSLYIRALDGQALLEHIDRIRPLFIQELHNWDRSKIVKALELFKERTNTLLELSDEVKSLYAPSLLFAYADDLLSPAAVTAMMGALSALEPWTTVAIKNAVKEEADRQSIALPKATRTLRLALTGTENGPGIFEVMQFLGCATVTERLHNYLANWHADRE